MRVFEKTGRKGSPFKGKTLQTFFQLPRNVSLCWQCAWMSECVWVMTGLDRGRRLPLRCPHCPVVTDDWNGYWWCHKHIQTNIVHQSVCVRQYMIQREARESERASISPTTTATQCILITEFRFFFSSFFLFDSWLTIWRQIWLLIAIAPRQNAGWWKASFFLLYWPNWFFTCLKSLCISFHF